MYENKAGLGYQDFRRMREDHIFYIDKTDFIKEWWEYSDMVTLITRPRRFGKTLNLSMAECFFSNRSANRGDLFEGLSIWQSEEYRNMQGTYPVIFLSFAPIKTGRIDEIKAALKQIVADVYREYRFIMEAQIFHQKDREDFDAVSKQMDDMTAYTALNRLCSYLYQYYHKNVIIMLDEYDTPMQEAWIAGCWDETVDFFRSFFNYTFKSNKYLCRGLITGITRISKESIFSDLNNLEVVTTTSEKYTTSFGFTEKETFEALEQAGLGAEQQKVKQWYDGFTFGSQRDMYNPWSIVSFLNKKGRYETYWANTSSNRLVNSLIQRGNSEIKKTMEALLQGNSFLANLDEQIMLNQLVGSTDAVWSLLLATGYLKVLNVRAEKPDDDGMMQYTLALTNLEVKKLFHKMIKGWFGDNAQLPYNDFIKALILDDVDSMNEFMNRIALCSFSNFDTAKGASGNDAPERFYHGFVLGLMVELAGRFRIMSNRESGFGRYDIVLVPVDQEKDNAYIIEFKVHKPAKEKGLEETVKHALNQIEEKQYAVQLISEGMRPDQIRKYGFAFAGKTCLIG
ncbi:MAG: AAA family ATPase [Lachnospiraceae bacterium]|nr:AAA family ATPase [Lachnospiraceae bacterium]